MLAHLLRLSPPGCSLASVVGAALALRLRTRAGVRLHPVSVDHKRRLPAMRRALVDASVLGPLPVSKQ